MADRLPKEEAITGDVVNPRDNLAPQPERTVANRRNDPNDRQEITQGTGPEALIGHSAATGEPLTKAEVFPPGSSMLEVDRASQPNHLGPQLEGAAETRVASGEPDPVHASPSAEHDTFGRSTSSSDYAAQAPLTTAEAIRDDSSTEDLRVEERLHEPDRYEPESGSSAGWHDETPAYDPKLVREGAATEANPEPSQNADALEDRPKE
ncbi:MAG: hypothetical protein C4331_03160 [Meiothermus sp.]